MQFYVTGQVVRDVLATRGISYSPYMYSTALFDCAWSRYRATVERNWQPYVEGRITLEQAITGTAKELSGG